MEPQAGFDSAGCADTQMALEIAPGFSCNLGGLRVQDGLGFRILQYVTLY